MLTVLETLGPTERAVFVLREVFDMPYDEIAEAVGKTPAAVRQVAHRAREHVAARRPRMQVSRDEQERAVERFLDALQSGDVQSLLDVLAPDVVLVSDGGGIVPAARRPIEGADQVARFLSAIATGGTRTPTWTPCFSTAHPRSGSTSAARRTPRSASSFEGGRISRIYAMRNPQKLDTARHRDAAHSLAPPREPSSRAPWAMTMAPSPQLMPSTITARPLSVADRRMPTTA